MNVDAAFRSIYGRAPSPEETNRFNRIGKELKRVSKMVAKSRTLSIRG
jgi:hypothetical protein